MILLSSSEICTPSSSNTKCLLPMTVLLPTNVVAIPWATMYSTSLCNSSPWARPRCLASFTMAVATLWGKCSSIHAACLSTSSSDNTPKDNTLATCGCELVKVPYLSKINVWPDDTE